VAAGALVAAVVLAGAVVVAADPLRARSSATTIDSGAKTGLARVSKGDLSARSMQNGTLGYAGDYQVVNKVAGTVTTLANVGDVVRQGKALYRVDGKPVILLKGAAMPAYRALSVGMQGADVQQLNAALVALGYTTRSTLGPNSDDFGRQTYYALRRLQDAVGLPVTGQMPLGQVVFLPADEIRITKVDGLRGLPAAPNQMIMTASSTARQVALKLNASQQATVAAGDEATITLPTGRSTPGRVWSVGKVATTDDSGTTVEVLIRPSRPRETGQLDQAPVQVSIVSETVHGVLSVPVNALLALAGGGYAVERVDAGAVHRLIAVRTGLFDDSAGRVQVSGAGLAAGQDVAVPAS
jgi:peptidoglycan hydrolase-like protein with peptidoglycan-binding domain